MMMGIKNSGEAAGFEFVLGTPKGCRSATTAILLVVSYAYPKKITDRREVILENKKATQIGSL
jgi:hypothetical protein